MDCDECNDIYIYILFVNICCVILLLIFISDLDIINYITNYLIFNHIYRSLSYFPFTSISI